MKKNTDGNEKRLGEIRKKMAPLGSVFFGNMSARTQGYTKADGTVSRQKAQSLFRFARTEGKMTRRIPSESEAAVYEAAAADLREYLCLVTRNLAAQPAAESRGTSGPVRATRSARV